VSKRETFRAELAPESLDESDGSIGVVAYTGATVDRYDYWTGERYTLAMDVSPEAVDLARVDAGTAPLLDSHADHSTDNVLGVIIPGSATFEGGALRLRAKLSVDPAKAGKVADIKAGVLRAVSVGADMLESKDTPASKGKLRHIQATRWQVVEASIVPVGADANAQTFAAQSPPVEAAMPQGDMHMDEIQLAAIKDESAKAERSRIAEIDRTALATKADPKHVAQLKADGVAIDVARVALINAAADRDAAAPAHTQISLTRDAGDTSIEQVKAALLAKANPSNKKFQSDMANRFRMKRTIDMIRELLSVRGVDHAGFSDERAARAYLAHSSSDFPDVLGDAIGKALVVQYESLPRLYEAFTARGSFSGLYAREPIILSGIGTLEEVAEAAEYPEGTLGDSKEAYSPKKYGKLISISLEAILKDNLDAFGRLPTMQASAARNKENSIIAALFAAGSGYGPTLGADSTALFNSAHGNLVDTGSGGVPTPARIDALMQLIEAQTDAQGEKLGLMGAKILVPSALHAQTMQYVHPSFTPTSASGVPTFTADQVHKFPFFANSAYWYVVADPMFAPAIEWAQPDNTDPLTLEIEDSFKNDCRTYKTRLWFGAAAIDYRGIALNRGS
jgi:hypothetical protein